MTTPVQIPHSRPTLGLTEERAVLEVLRSGHLAQGAEVEAFEQDMARALQRTGAVAVSSGTVALELALLALGIGDGHDVIMPSYVCAALWHATVRTGATPVLVDIELDTCQIDAAAAKRALTPRTKAILVPHLFGLPANLGALARLGVPLIEDCAQTLGAQEAGRPVGSVGTITVCSFYATKLLCAGEGGMVLSNEQAVLDRVRRLREYDESSMLTRGASNLKMTDLHAAIGRSQLTQLSTFVTRRQEIATRYRTAWESLPLTLPSVPVGRTHVYFRYVVKTDGGRLETAPAADLVAHLARQGLQCRRPVFQPLHRYLNQSGFERTETVHRTALSIPIYPCLTEEDIARVIQLVHEACHEVAQS